MKSSIQKKHHGRLFWIALALIGSGFLVFSMPVSAQAWVAAQDRLSLRAGPYNQFPEIAWVAPGQAVMLYGCLPDRTWCDVKWNAYRGWVWSWSIGMDQGGFVYSPYSGRWFYPAITAPLYIRRQVPSTGVWAPPAPITTTPSSPMFKQEVIDRTPRLPQIIP